MAARTFNRRGFLLAAGGGAAVVAAGVAGDFLVAEASGGGDGGETVAFHGAHQAGIVTPAQDRIVFGAFDVTATGPAELESLLRDWTAAAEKMTAGLPLAEMDDELPAPPVDTGEALGLPAARLTITFGFGPALFDDRFGLAGRRPAGFDELPAFPRDALQPARSGGDLCVQACADDPVVAFHAVRNLARIGFGRAGLRWTQLGFGRSSATGAGQTTPRNLQGFKDGTNNIRGDDEAALAEHVWVGDEAPAWMRGGSYLVARRIRMLIETWDRSSLDDQQQTIGRLKASGAPLTGSSELDPVDLSARDSWDEPVIPLGAHIRLAAPASNRGARILRRGYSYTDGIDPATGELDAGLFFVAFQRDVGQGFVAIQSRLAGRDALDEYIVHTGSAVFAVPPGARPGGFVGEALF